MKRILLFLALAGESFSGYTQTFTGTGGGIPDVTTTDFPLTVSGLNPATIDTLNFGLETVCINLTHTYDSDLDIRLIAPDGTDVLLSSGQGGGGHDYTNTCFDVFASSAITTGTPPFTGSFKPQGPMGSVNNGQNGNGTWILRITDMAGADTGYVFSWHITFGNNPATYPTFHSSNLPIVVINTHNQAIVDEPKTKVDFSIIYNGPGIRNYLNDPYYYTGLAGIEFRGSSSQGFPKKPYGVETWAADSSSLDTSLLGMPSEHDWILNANYSDKTLLHNVLSYDIAQKQGHYATRWQMVEVVIDGQYEGVYIFSEKIKRDKNRVDVSKLSTNDNSWPNISGGYIFKVDKSTGNGGGGWVSNYAPAVSSGGQTIYFQYDYPNDVTITPQQKNYLAAYVDSFETALYNNNFDTLTGWRRYAKMNSFVDYFLVNEMSRNVDGYRLSTYLYKHRITKGGKLAIGPVWDYDIAWHNANYCDGWRTDGWAYQFGNVCGGDYWQIPMWWDHLMLDTNFTNTLRCRWEQLKVKTLSVDTLQHWIDSMATYLNEGQQRNFERWPILGSYVWPNVSPIPQTYQEEIDTLKSWIAQRWAWLDANIPGNASHCSFTGIAEEKDDNDGLTVFPNPFNTQLNLLLDLEQAEKVELVLYDLTGRAVLQNTTQLPYGPQRMSLSTGDLAAGVYTLRVRIGDRMLTRKIIRNQ